MSTSRVPSGVPTGGQFAASAHAESGVSLTGTAPTAAQAAPSETEQAFAALAKIQNEANRLHTIGMLVAARNEARANHPDAVYLAFDRGDGDEGGTWQTVTALDADGQFVEHLENGYDEFRADVPDDVHALDRKEKGLSESHDVVLDMAALDRIDLAAEVRKGEMSLATDAIGRNAIDSFVLDTDSIKEQIDAEMSFGTFNDYLDNDESLTVDEEAQVMAEFRASAVNFEPVVNDFHYETQRAVEAVLDRTRRGHE